MRSHLLLLMVILTFASMEASLLFSKIRAPKPQIDYQDVQNQFLNWRKAFNSYKRSSAMEPLGEEELKWQLRKSPISIFWRFGY